MTVSTETVRMAKSRPRKNQSERSDLPCHIIIELICCARRILNVTKSRLNICICQHCSVKTNTVTPSFYYVFKISLSCYNSIRSFIRNLWRVLLLGSHLKIYIFGSFIGDPRGLPLPKETGSRRSPAVFRRFPPFFFGLRRTELRIGSSRLGFLLDPPHTTALTVTKPFSVQKIR